VEPRKIGGLLRAIDSYVGHPTTQAALRLAPLVFLRPGELRSTTDIEPSSANSLGALSRIRERTAISASFDSDMSRFAASAENCRFSSSEGRTVIDGSPDDGVSLLIAVRPICCKRRTLRYPAITQYSIHMHALRS
jgi:hypothetical protein